MLSPPSFIPQWLSWHEERWSAGVFRMSPLDAGVVGYGGAIFRCELFFSPFNPNVALLQGIAPDNVKIVEVVAVDQTGFLLALCCIVLFLIRPRLIQSPSMQLIASFVFGVIVLVVVLAFFVLKDIRHTRLGQLGVMLMFSLGGVAALSEGLLSAAASYVLFELQRNLIVQCVLGVSGVTSAVLSHFVFYEKLPRIMNMVCIGLMVTLSLVWFNHYREANVAVLLLLGCVKLFASSRCSSFSQLCDEGPRDAVPMHGKFVPFCQGVGGGSTEAKMNAFEAHGRLNTQVELEKLARVVRRNPQAFTTRVKDPNGLSRWAQVKIDDSDSE